MISTMKANSNVVTIPTLKLPETLIASCLAVVVVVVGVRRFKPS